MTSIEFQSRLSERADRAGLSELSAAWKNQLEAYFRLLSLWSAKINLTALPLQRPTDQTFDRLLIEPIIAARYVPSATGTWFDFGSGGGSPAIPLKIVRPQIRLAMVEIRERRAAFLREVVRHLNLEDTTVVNDGFESVACDTQTSLVDLVTVRALRADRQLFDAIERLLTEHGRVMLFHSKAMKLTLPIAFDIAQTVELRTVGSPLLTIARRAFHVEQQIR